MKIFLAFVCCSLHSTNFQNFFSEFFSSPERPLLWLKVFLVHSGIRFRTVLTLASMCWWRSACLAFECTVLPPIFPNSEHHQKRSDDVVWRSAFISFWSPNKFLNLNENLLSGSAYLSVSLSWTEESEHYRALSVPGVYQSD